MFEVVFKINFVEEKLQFGIEIESGFCRDFMGKTSMCALWLSWLFSKWEL